MKRLKQLVCHPFVKHFVELWVVCSAASSLFRMACSPIDWLVGRNQVLQNESFYVGIFEIGIYFLCIPLAWSLLDWAKEKP
jgi:hypothetical protein